MDAVIYGGIALFNLAGPRPSGPSEEPSLGGRMSFSPPTAGSFPVFFQLSFHLQQQQLTITRGLLWYPLLCIYKTTQLGGFRLASYGLPLKPKLLMVFYPFLTLASLRNETYGGFLLVSLQQKSAPSMDGFPLNMWAPGRAKEEAEMSFFDLVTLADSTWAEASRRKRERGSG